MFRDGEGLAHLSWADDAMVPCTATQDAQSPHMEHREMRAAASLDCYVDCYVMCDRQESFRHIN